MENMSVVINRRLERIMSGARTTPSITVNIPKATRGYRFSRVLPVLFHSQKSATAPGNKKLNSQEIDKSGETSGMDGAEAYFLRHDLFSLIEEAVLVLSREQPDDPSSALAAFFDSRRDTSTEVRHTPQISLVTFSLMISTEPQGPDFRAMATRSSLHAYEEYEEFITYLSDLADSVRRATT
jgi:hypothetical protein